MTTQRKVGRKTRQARPAQGGRRAWYLIGGLVILVGLTATLVYRLRPTSQFVLKGGERSVLVLLRSEQDAVYRLQYDGNRSVSLNQVQVMLQGQVIHVDVMEVELRRAGDNLLLDNLGNLPSGEDFTLQPGDEFEVRIRYAGRTLGGNYLYGFRVHFQRGGQQRTIDLPLGEEYTVFVE